MKQTIQGENYPDYRNRSAMCSERDEWNPPEITVDFTRNVLCFSTPFHEYKGGVVSSSFHGDKYKDTTWRLKLYPKGFDKRCGNWADM